MTPQVPTPDYPFAADEVAYDNDDSGLASSNMQDAIDEVAGAVDGNTASIGSVLSLLANKPMAATIGVPGDEVDDTVTVTVQLKDLAGANLSVKGFVHLYLTTDEDGESVYREAWFTEGGAGSLVLGSSADDWAGAFTSDDSGVVEAVVNVQSNIAETLYLHVTGPLGNILASSAAIEFSAAPDFSVTYQAGADTITVVCSDAGFFAIAGSDLPDICEGLVLTINANDTARGIQPAGVTDYGVNIVSGSTIVFNNASEFGSPCTEIKFLESDPTVDPESPVLFTWTGSVATV